MGDVCILPRLVLDLAGLLKRSTCLSHHVRSHGKPVEIEPHCSPFCPMRGGIVLTHGLFGWPYNTLCYPRYRRCKIYSHLYLPLYLCTLKPVNKLSTCTFFFFFWSNDRHTLASIEHSVCVHAWVCVLYSNKISNLNDRLAPKYKCLSLLDFTLQPH